MHPIHYRLPVHDAATDSRRRHACSVTIDELRQIGLCEVAYVTGIIKDDGECDFTINGADGVAVTVLDDLQAVWEFARSHELMLVTVH